MKFIMYAQSASNVKEMSWPQKHRYKRKGDPCPTTPLPLDNRGDL
jgi:hypothetical protein